MTRAEEWGIFDHIAKAAIIHCKIDVYKDRGAKAYTFCNRFSSFTQDGEYM